MTTTNPLQSLRLSFASLGEKVLWTFIEVFVTGFALSSQLGADIAQASLVAAVAAAITVVANGLPQPPLGLSFGVDLGYRVARTFVASFLSVIVAVPVFDWTGDLLYQALMVAGPPVFVIIKGLAAKHTGNPATAATLSYGLDPSMTVEFLQGPPGPPGPQGPMGMSTGAPLP